MLQAFLATYATCALAMFLIYMGISWLLFDTARLEEHYPGTFIQHADWTVSQLPAARKGHINATRLWVLAGLLWPVALMVLVQCLWETRKR